MKSNAVGALLTLGLLAGQAQATTYDVNALDCATFTTTLIPVQGANTTLALSPLYTFAPGDTVNFGTAAFTPFLQFGIGSGSGASEAIGNYRAVFSPIGPAQILQFHPDLTSRGCATAFVPPSDPSHCNNFVPSPGVSALLQFTLPSNATQIQLALIGPFSYTTPSIAVPGPVAGASIPVLGSLLGLAWWRRRRTAGIRLARYSVS